MTVDHAHQGEVPRALALWHVVERRTADRRQPALPDNRQGGMVGPGLPPISGPALKLEFGAG